MSYSVRLLGRGQTQLAALGLADAEHRVETELARQWPDASIHVTDIQRTHAESRIAEEFAVAYLLRATVTVDAPDADAARGTAFRAARRTLERSRFWTVRWEEALVAEGEENG